MWLKIIVLLATLSTIAVNGLANALPLNGQNTGEISNRYPLLITPAGYAFSIWGLIYLGLIAFSVFQIFSKTWNESPARKRVSLLYILSSAANIGWIFSWHYNYFPLSLLMMFVMLGSLIGVYLSLGIGRNHPTTLIKRFVENPFSLYLGWISVATIVNVALLLFQNSWSGWGVSPQIWTVVMIAVAGVLGILALISRKDVVYTAVLIWAISAIAVKTGQNPMVVKGAWSVSAILTAAAVASLFFKRPLV